MIKLSSEEEPIGPEDALRTLESVNDPDPRTLLFVGWKTIEEHLGNVSIPVLDSSVPREVRVQFETLRNLHLYSWHVYGFRTVVEQFAYTVLELGLKVALEPFYEEYRSRFSGKAKPHAKPGLRGWLKMAINEKYIVPLELKHYKRLVWGRAHHRQAVEEYERLNAAGEFKGFVSVGEEVQIKGEDYNFDYVAVLTDAVPNARNILSHGSASLGSSTTHSTVQLVAEILNYIYGNLDASE